MSPAAISTDHAPAAIGPYSQAIEADGWVFCSGQIGLDPATGQLVAGGTAPEVAQVMQNLQAVLAAAGLGFAQVVRTTVYLVDLADFAAVNAVYGECFLGPPPARSTVQAAALPKNARVEIEVIAIRH
jgi:2-iminobutanoate/2-iminopropanoate deaminase